MDSTESGQSEGVRLQEESGDVFEGIGDGERNHEPTETSSSSEPVAGAPKWEHDQEISFRNILPGLLMIKEALEQAVKVQKSELDRLQHRVSQFNK